MTVRQIVTVIAILLLVIAVVGLILCRPMAVSGYASGIFNLAAVTDARVAATTNAPEGPDGRILLLTGDDETLNDLVELFEGRGFGMTPAGLFSHGLPEPAEGDMEWSVTFHCSIAESTLTAEYRGGKLRLTGDHQTLVTTRHKDAWAKQVYDLIASLYPEPETEETE